MCSLSIQKDKEDHEDGEEVERNKKEESLHWDLIDEMVHSLGRAWPAKKETQGITLTLKYWASCNLSPSLAGACLFIFGQQIL